jgi:hypothetical protein
MNFCSIPRTFALLALGVMSTGDTAAEVDFNRDVRPILSDKCFACHGPDAQQVKGDLRLDLSANAFRVQDGHAAIVPGDPAKSEVILRITSTDPDEIMPPAESHKELKPAEIATLRDWIKQGAKYDQHWSYRKLDWPTVPEFTGSGVVNPIDQFVQSNLEAQTLSPSKATDRVTLLRRLSFDLLGLPPSAAEMKAFVADRSKDAYEKAVDRLLKSPHYGERMAVYWLDLVRYADTRGYHGDQHQNVTPFRDYVIEAFNDNLPFDRFTAEQLAGDLFPEATMQQKIASGYNKLLMTTTEGGAQPKEYIAKYAADRVRNASTVWLGSTLGCSECHDHKYDPFTQKDFYSFAAFFADVKETPVGGLTSVIKLPTDQETTQLASLGKQISPLEKQIKDELAKLEYEEPEAEVLKAHLAKATEKKPEVKSQTDAQTKEIIIADDEKPAAKTVRANKDTHPFKWDDKLKFSGKRSWTRSSEGVAQDVFDFLTEPPTVQEGDTFFVHAYLNPTNSPKALMVQFRTDNWNHRANWGDMTSIGYGGKTENAKKTDFGKLPETGKWVKLEIPVDKVNMDPGSEVVSVALSISGGTVHWDKLGLITTEGPVKKSTEKKAAKKKEPLEIESEISFDSWQKWVKKKNYKGIDRGLKGILQKAVDKRSEKDATRALNHYLENVHQPHRKLFGAIRKKLDPLKKERDALDKGILRTMITEKLPAPRTMRVLPRGNWQDDSGAEVTPAVPASLGQITSAKERANRLDLAAWLTSRENPLVARVFVNRLWKIMFGRGLASTLDDFGMQGTHPSHPELLDWLAMEFIASGWDVKHTLKLIAMSHTYRQSSVADDSQVARDPYNDLLARQGRFRLDAEMVRDNALQVAQLLVDEVGGRSVKPYQPEGYWVHLNFPKRKYAHDEGDKKYRRGVYTYWCRTFLHPSLAAFDASSREECVVERVRSNTPQQALVLLNDPTYVEAARTFAERIVSDGGDSTVERLEFAYTEAVSRDPSANESKLLGELFESHLKQFRKETDAAESLLKTGLRESAAKSDKVDKSDPAELAAWTSVARVIFNLHEFITRQ